MDRKEPLTPIPKRAMLTTMKAKWYHLDTEKNLVNDISKVSVASETMNSPR